MPIPSTPRVVYQNAVLDRVICDLRFPTVLRINSGEPVDFQEAIRQNFPLYSAIQPAVPPDLPKEFVTLLNGSLSQQRSFKFITDDHNSTVRLSVNTISLTTKAYTRWEHFRAMFIPVLESLERIYSPTFFQRVGLGYRDVIVRSKLGLQDVPWKELLNPHIAGELGNADLATDIIDSQSSFELKLPSGVVSVTHGLARLKSSDEQCYIIDTDFFHDAKTELTHALEKLDGFNSNAGHILRWCITDRLHQAMQPQPVS